MRKNLDTIEVIVNQFGSTASSGVTNAVNLVMKFRGIKYQNWQKYVFSNFLDFRLKTTEVCHSLIILQKNFIKEVY